MFKATFKNNTRESIYLIALRINCSSTLCNNNSVVVLVSCMMKCTSRKEFSHVISRKSSSANVILFPTIKLKNKVKRQEGVGEQQSNIGTALYLSTSTIRTI